MTVTPDMIARAKRCDCDMCKRYLNELEKAYLDNMKIGDAIEEALKK